MLAKSKSLFVNQATKPCLCVVSAYSRGKNLFNFCLIRHKKRRNMINHAHTAGAWRLVNIYQHIIFCIWEWQGVIRKGVIYHVPPQTRNHITHELARFAFTQRLYNADSSRPALFFAAQRILLNSAPIILFVAREKILKVWIITKAVPISSLFHKVYRDFTPFERTLQIL